eukprot:540104-Hanusia_phi.AAC.2
MGTSEVRRGGGCGEFEEASRRESGRAVRCELWRRWLRRRMRRRLKLMGQIDVEGDELEVLMGLQADDWAKIKQVRR